MVFMAIFNIKNKLLIIDRLLNKPIKFRQSQKPRDNPNPLPRSF